MDIKASPAALIYQNLKKEFQAGITEATTVADPLYGVVPSTSDSNVYGWLGHIPGFKEWHANQPRVLRNVESNDMTVANRKFEDTIQIDRDTVEDNQLSSYAGVAKSMGAAGKLVYDELVFELFNNGFGTTLAYDGLSWFNDAHRVGLSTVNNNIGTLALSSDNLETAITRLRSFKVQPDKLSAARPLNPVSNKLMLVVPPDLEMTARKIVSVKTVSNGGENWMYNVAEILVSSWLTDANAWFVVNVGGPVKPIFMQKREELNFRMLTPEDSDDAFMRDTYIYGAKMRCAALVTYPWLAVGSGGPN